MYTYSNLLDDVNYLAHYGVATGSIGSSAAGKLIPYIHVGSEKGAQIIVTAAIHAREHVTSFLVVKQAYAMLNSYDGFGGGVYFIPMLNPDGNILIDKGVDEFPAQKKFLLEINGGGDFSLWKANINGVDLNTNFPAAWGTGKHNITHPASENYIGSSPLSEVETRALASFTNKVRPLATISYHALGREIYWDFAQTENRARDYSIAHYAAMLTGYTLIDGANGSAGGYKDWCVSALNIPALTIEVVSDKFSHPLDNSSIAEDFELNKFLPLKILKLLVVK